MDTAMYGHSRGRMSREQANLILKRGLRNQTTIPVDDWEWWAHLDSNQGPTDYEGKTSGRRFKLS
jgi:hypothetical protein